MDGKCGLLHLHSLMASEFESGGRDGREEHFLLGSSIFLFLFSLL
jgi:hypothetical protein